MSEYQYYEFQAIDRPLTAKLLATERADGYRVFLRVRARLRLALADAGGLVA